MNIRCYKWPMVIEKKKENTSKKKRGDCARFWEVEKYRQQEVEAREANKRKDEQARPFLSLPLNLFSVWVSQKFGQSKNDGNH